MREIGTREIGGGLDGPEQVDGGGTRELEREIAVARTGVVGITRAHQPGPAVALIDDQGFSVIGLGVQQAKVGAQTDIIAPDRIRQPAARAVAKIAAAQAPEAGPQWIGIWQ